MSFRQMLASVAMLALVGVAFAQAPTTPATAPSPAIAASTAAPASASSSAAAELTKLEAVPTKPGDATAGQPKAAVCGACHGMDGNSSDAQYPKLAGQNEQYIVRQLMNFKSGSRVNAIMQPMATPLAPQDMHDIAAYFASQKSRPGVTDDALAGPGGKLFREGDPNREIPACMSCHGPDGHGNPGAVYPQLAGQHADYVQKQLQGWHDGDNVWGSNAHAQIMPAIAMRLTAADIAAVSSYVEGLHTAQPGEKVAGPEAAAPASPASASTAANAPASAATAPASGGSVATPAAASSAGKP